MERSLFLNTKKQKHLQDYGLSIAHLSFEEFQLRFSSEIKKQTLDLLSALDPKIQKGLYFLGSFGLNHPSLFSDIDLCFMGSLSKENKKTLDDLLRKEFRKYSLLFIKDLEDLESVSNFKTLISLKSIEPIFFTQNQESKISDEVFQRIIKPKENKIKSLLQEETKKRRLRFGEQSGKLLFSFKTASGGILDLKTLDFYGLKSSEKENFIYKLRVLNQILYQKDQFFVTHAKTLYEFMGFSSENDFFKTLYNNLFSVKEQIDETLFAKWDWMGQVFSKLGLNLCEREKKDYIKKVNALWGRVNSPYYHVYTVGEHLKACFLEALDLIKAEEKKFLLTKKEKEILLWACLFHDLGKDQTRIPHSRQGSVYVQEFGRLWNWPNDKIKLVAWLVREHLTLSQHAFKMDPFNPELLEKLSLKGVSGRRAIILFLLTVADTKATHPQSWSEFKKDVLTAVLNQILGVEDQFKNKLVEGVSQDRVYLVEGLGLKEIAMVPHEFLVEDLKGGLDKGFKVYKKQGAKGFWLRYYSQKDHLGLAHQIISFLDFMGVYVDLALFSKKSKEGDVYNWFKVESSLSFKAFEKRLSLFEFDPSKGVKEESKVSLHHFRAIQVRHKTYNYAVLSFQGQDKPGLLLAAVEVLASASMSILWGHAITWGQEVEDVFGVSFTDSSDWSFTQV